MKPITIFLLFLALTFNLLAQPTTITWQGKLLDSNSNAITQNNVAMTFAMFDASSGGNQLWPTSGAVAKAVNVLNGLYSVQLGTGSGDDIAFTAAMFNGKTPWLEVKVGTETLPRTEITNVPFALISNDLSTSGWENPGEIGKTAPNTGKFTSLETGNMKITTSPSVGKVLTSDAEGNAAWETPNYEAPGTAPGQMQYWNGTAWVPVEAWQNGQILKIINGIPTWVPDDLINNLEVGDYYQGGIIAYFLQSGDPGYDANVRHGIIAAPTDQSNGCEWGCFETDINGAGGTALGTGAQNTADIVAGCSEAGIAARICSDLVRNGYSDWYLPSFEEIKPLYLNRIAIGGFSSDYYWSSSEFSSTSAVTMNFTTGVLYFSLKNIVARVRAIRAF